MKYEKKNIIFFISLKKLGLDLYYECDNITFQEGNVCDEICLWCRGFRICSFSVDLFKLVFNFEEGNTHYYDLVSV